MSYLRYVPIRVWLVLALAITLYVLALLAGWLVSHFFLAVLLTVALVTYLVGRFDQAKTEARRRALRGGAR
jgi:ABC-type transport system involved in cytochrome bd biosynthesis fused ATPase/permease subunit